MDGRGSVPSMGKNFLQTDYESHRASDPVNTGGDFSGGKSAGTTI
jgi:hypothetical protein